MRRGAGDGSDAVWVHRTFHTVGFLWPFHAIHHSVEEMDWLAGSRLHLVDVILTRGLTYVPIFLLGFSRPALLVYVFLVAAQATFIHANVRWTLTPLRRLVAWGQGQYLVLEA
nr:sterol desaturase family protein [Luteitalea pratensis]